MTEVKRDRWGRPLIKLAFGDGDAVPYKRASSFGKPLDDLNNIILWKQRITAKGLVENPHLQLALSAAGDDKRALNRICDEAFKAGGGETKADIGTSLHKLCEMYDLGEDLGFIPDQYRADLEAYRTATACFAYEAVERFMVHDGLRAAGTPDRIATLKTPLHVPEAGVTLPEGWTGITDIKTGGIGFPHGFAVQLGLYANSQFYNPETGRRSEPPSLDTDYAILVHLPAGEGRCDLHLLNIGVGYDAARLATQVDEWRKTKNLTYPIEPVGSVEEAA